MSRRAIYPGDSTMRILIHRDVSIRLQTVPMLALLVCLGLPLASGCGSGQQAASQNRTNERPAPAVSPSATPPRTRTGAAQQDARNRTITSREENQQAAAPLPDGPRTLADLLTDAEPENGTGALFTGNQDSTQRVRSNADAIAIDDTRAAVAGIRKVTGKHLTLYTDLPIGAKADDLPTMFDLAVPQWCAYFGLDATRAAQWHVTGFLMQDKGRFQAAGLLPDNLPPFRNGYQRGPYIWAYDQPDVYYSQHLVLHEGTHAFMDMIVGGFGPPWYSEGMAELLGTHKWQNGQLTLAYLPRDKTETPGWGRVRIIQDELAAGRGRMPKDIMEYGPQAHLLNAPYGWCWGLAAFFDAHPLSQQAFRQLRDRVPSGDVTPWLTQQLQKDWSSLSEDWQIFVMDIQYGYDVARAAVVRKPAAPLPPGGVSATIAADRGWQSTGIRLEPGVSYRLLAAGRYQVAETSEIWWCEPGGVTIHYYNGRPLGILLGAVRDDTQPLQGLSPLVRPETIGLQKTWTPKQGGTLFLKINESAADLWDNQGEIFVQVTVAE
jgi:hypothetical protein